jgi:hypothetical protein
MYEQEQEQKPKSRITITRDKSKCYCPDSKRRINFKFIPLLGLFSYGEGSCKEYFIKIPPVIAAPTEWCQRSAEEWDTHGAMLDAASWNPDTGEIVGFKVPDPSIASMLRLDPYGVRALHMANAVSLTDFRRQLFIAPDAEVCWFPRPTLVVNGGEFV